jgi:serine/threonine-protein phosphatase 6 catalytic subunit
MKNLDELIDTVLQCKIISEEEVKILCRRVKALLFEESNAQPVQAPVTICGDVHGQFWDLLELLQKGGPIPEERYIFLGDFVDRGYNSVETILLLFLYKLKYP